MSFLVRIRQALSAPGCKKVVEEAAPTQLPLGLQLPNDKATSTTSVAATDSDDASIFHVDLHHGRLDRWLDVVVRCSGSSVVFSIIMCFLLGWLLSGIHYHSDINWQIAISNIQAIFSYIFDSLLMRQQLNANAEALLASAQLRSRGRSHRRMLAKIASMDRQPSIAEKDDPAAVTSAAVEASTSSSSFEMSLPAENWFGRLMTRLAFGCGHIVSITFYWAIIVLWLALGPSNKWSNEWQLYINSATSALMVFVFAFLANIRERHAEYERLCLQATFRVDAYLERRLREVTQDDLPNEVVVIEPRKINALQRAVYYYADVVGTLVGIALLFIVMIAWLAVGPAMHFNDNWWLFIGTYAGLIGLNDGFVLRNVQAKLKDEETEQFRVLDEEDEGLFAVVGETSGSTANGVAAKPSLSSRISLAVGRVCASEVMVLAGVCVILALLAGASAMKWNTTGMCCFLLSFLSSPLSLHNIVLILILFHSH